MRNNIIEIIAAQPRQLSDEWYKNRLGNFTGSQVGRLMKKGRGKDAEWSADAIAYIKEVVAERLLNPATIEIQAYFDEYRELVDATSKMIAWGHDNEDNALNIYSKLMGQKVTQCGSLPHESITSFWDSPDGVLLDDDGVVEVKCPMPKTHALYLTTARTPEELQAVKPEYYWQCVAHMAVTGAKYCDFISYCKFLRPALHIVRIVRDDEVIEELIQRIEQADSMANEMLALARTKNTAVKCHSNC